MAKSDGVDFYADGELFATLRRADFYLDDVLRHFGYEPDSEEQDEKPQEIQKVFINLEINKPLR